MSAALGAFLAGLLLAESPFATQVRSDVSGLRTLFVTLFFSSIGMVADPAWAVQHWPAVVVAVAVIVVGKAAVASGVVWLLGASVGHALATGMCVAQVGEFSFVLAAVARSGGLIDDDLFKLVVSATIATLFLTPAFVAAAPRLVSAFARKSRSGAATATGALSAGAEELRDHVVIVGFGPAGQRIAEALLPRYCSRVIVAELNRRSLDVARGYGLRTCLGDATRSEVLEQLALAQATAVVVTVPDPKAARRIIEGVRALAPGSFVIARARYHLYRWELLVAGAEVVDEEDQVGLRIAAAVRRRLRLADVARSH